MVIPGIDDKLTPDDLEAISKLWEICSRKKGQPGRPSDRDLMDQFKRTTKKTMTSAPIQGSFAALDDVCGKLIDVFLDPVRRHDNPMFDVQPIIFEFLDRLELEHRKNSVWLM